MNNIIYPVGLTLLFIAINCSSSKPPASEVNNKYGLTQEQYDYIKTEQPGGKLDYEPRFSQNKLVILDDVAYNKKDAALYTWGMAMKKVGIKKIEDAISLFEEIRSVTLRDTQKRSMQNGFNK